MIKPVILLTALLGAGVSANSISAESALAVLGADFTFPNQLEGLPAKLSDFPDLQIHAFKTSDGVKLAYWEAGHGKPLIFVPGWSANGAEYINVMYLLREHYHVYVLDPRNQGLSAKVDFGLHISRYAKDLKDFNDHLGIKSAYYCGWSMGASVLYSYIDLFGAEGIEKLVLIDEPPSIVAHADWTPQQRLSAGSIADSPDEVIRAFTSGASNSILAALNARFNAMDSPYFQNSEGFARSFVKNDPKYMIGIMYDHASNDWQDVIRTKIKVPTAIFTGDYSANVPSQRWMHSVIPGSVLYVYSKAEQGDHFLAFKNPVKFTKDLQSFLNEGGTTVSSEDRIGHKEILRADAAWNGAPYMKYPVGTPEPVVAEITIPAHGELLWHSHPMPSFAYVLAGEIAVEDKQGNKQHFVKGQVMPETVNTAHRGTVGDQPATFIVFYAAVKGMQLSTTDADKATSKSIDKERP